MRPEQQEVVLWRFFLPHSLEQTAIQCENTHVLPQISSIHSSFSEHLQRRSVGGDGGQGYHAAKWVKKRGNEKGRGLNDHLRDGQFKSPSIN